TPLQRALAPRNRTGPRRHSLNPSITSDDTHAWADCTTCISDALYFVPPNWLLANFCSPSRTSVLVVVPDVVIALPRRHQRPPGCALGIGAVVQRVQVAHEAGTLKDAPEQSP